MSTSNETQCLHIDYSEITLTKVKSLKCNEFISILESHNDLS
jgi:hypothetical protein